MKAGSEAVTSDRGKGFTRPLTGYRVLCVGDGGRAPVHAARMLADMGADVLYAGSPGTDALARIMLGRAPAVRIVGRGELGQVGDVFAVVHQQQLDERLAALPALASANRVRLDWLSEGGEGGSDEAAQAVAGAACAIGDRHRAPLWFPHRLGEYIQGVNACGVVLYFALCDRSGATGTIALADIWGYAAGTMRMLCEPKGIRYYRDGRRSPGNGGVYPQRLFRAKDGFVALLCRSSKEWSAIMRAFGNPAWGENPRYRDLLSMAREYPDEVDVLVESETIKHTKVELFERAIAEGFPLAAVRSPMEAVQDEYLTRQNFWTETEGVRLPGSLWRPETFRTADVNAVVADRPSRDASKPGLTGYRVLDLSWVWAGPMVGSMLADLGAEVIKVEHVKRLDNLRLRGKLPSAIPEAHKHIDPRETDPLFHNVNRGKKSVLLDMKSEQGRKLFLQLVAQSDIVLESFRPHVLDAWGLGYAELKRANPRVVLLSLRGLELDESFGLSGLRSYAPITSALSGLESQIRYEDANGPTGGMAIGISDPVAGWHGFTLLLGALVNAKRSGTGGWIRLSQLETLSSMLPEMYLTAQKPGLAPAGANAHAVRCIDGDAIVQADHDVWTRLVAQGAIARQDGDWHGGKLSEFVIAIEAAGGRAWPVLDVDVHDRWKQVLGRPLMAAVNHLLCGEEQLLTHGWQIDGQAVLPSESAPVIGAHTRSVLGDWLGLEQRDLDKLEAQGVLS